MPYPVLFTTPRGVEELVIEELRGLGLATKRVPGADGRIQGEVDTPLTLARLCYQARTIFRGLLVLAEEVVQTGSSGLDDIYTLVRGIAWEDWLSPAAAFCVRAHRNGEHGYQSPDIQRVAGQAIIDRIQEQSGQRQPVRLRNPDVRVQVDVIEETCRVSLDFVGEEALHRRTYRPYVHPSPLNTVLAAAMVLASGWQPHEQLVDPLCGGGTIAIEAALYARRVPGGFFRKHKFPFPHLRCFTGQDLSELFRQWDARIDWQLPARIWGSDRSARHIQGAQANAFHFSVADTIRWQVLELAELPEVFPPGSVRCIITNPPFGVRLGSLRQARTVQEILCKVTHEVLSDDGQLVVITHHADWFEEVALTHGLLPCQRYTVLPGDLLASLFVLRRKEG